MQQISPIKERILQYIENKGISKYKFYQETGIARGVLDKESGISEENIAKFIAYAPEVSLNWLFKNEGEIIETKDEKKVINLNDNINDNLFDKKRKVEKKYTNERTNVVAEDQVTYGVPLIPIDAMAGFGTGAVQVMDYHTETYVVPEFTELKVDFMIRVKGSSMYPKYNSGDLVACKKLSLNDIFFQWNKVYVLDTEQGALIKRIKKSEKPKCITLVSENASYDAFELSLSEIHAIALVVGVIRLE